MGIEGIKIEKGKETDGRIERRREGRKSDRRN